MSRRQPRLLDRNLAVPGLTITLCITVNQWRKVLEHFGLDPQTPMYGHNYAGATTTFVSNSDGERAALVAIKEHSKKVSPIDIACLLVHEAVHIWQEYCDSIGEHKPGSEQEAYAIQYISTVLMKEYVRLTKK